MDLTPEQFEDLVGAYALDACEPDEVEAMERYVARHRESATEVERLREVAAGIGAAGASSPPGTLRERLLHAAEDRVSPLEADTALQRETDRFDTFLDTLVEHDLAVRTHNGLTVHELVQHLEAIDRAFVDAAHDPTTAYIGPREVEAVTARDLSERAGEPFADTITRFRSTRGQLVRLRDVVRDEGVVGEHQRVPPRATSWRGSWIRWTIRAEQSVVRGGQR